MHWLIGRIERKPLSNWSGWPDQPHTPWCQDSFLWLIYPDLFRDFSIVTSSRYWINPRPSVDEETHWSNHGTLVFCLYDFFTQNSFWGWILQIFLQLIWSRFGLSLSSILISGPPIWFPQIDWLPRRLATNSRLADRQRFRFLSFFPLFSVFHHIAWVESCLEYPMSSFKNSTFQSLWAEGTMRWGYFVFF